MFGPELCVYFKMFNVSKIVGKLALISFFKCLIFMFSTAMTSHRPTNYGDLATIAVFSYSSNRKAMNRNWSKRKANPDLKTKAGNK